MISLLYEEVFQVRILIDVFVFSSYIINNLMLKIIFYPKSQVNQRGICLQLVGVFLWVLNDSLLVIRFFSYGTHFFFLERGLNLWLMTPDLVCFALIRNEKNQLLLGIRRANRPQTVMPSSVLSSDSMHLGLLAAAAHAAATYSRFTIFYNPRYAACSWFDISWFHRHSSDIMFNSGLVPLNLLYLWLNI